MLEKYKIIFDFDNTLVASWGIIFCAFNKTLEHYGMNPWTEEEMRSRIKFSPRDYFPQLFGENAHQASKIYLNAYLDHSATLQPIEGARDLLAYIKDLGLSCYIISNKRGNVLRQEIGFLGWGDFFVQIVGSEDFAHDKPDPRIVDFTIGAKGIRKAVFIGDADVDFLCAKAASCISFGVFPDKNICYQHSPDIWCQDLYQVRNELQKLEDWRDKS